MSERDKELAREIQAQTHHKKSGPTRNYWNFKLSVDEAAAKIAAFVNAQKPEVGTTTAMEIAERLYEKGALRDPVSTNYSKTFVVKLTAEIIRSVLPPPPRVAGGDKEVVHRIINNSLAEIRDYHSILRMIAAYRKSWKCPKCGQPHDPDDDTLVNLDGESSEYIGDQ